VDGRPNHKNKAALSSFTGVVCMESERTDQCLMDRRTILMLTIKL